MRLFKKCVLGYLRIKLSKQGFVVYFSGIILLSHSWNKGPWKFVIRHDTVHIWLILLAIVSGMTLSKKWNYSTLLMVLSTWTRRLWIFFCYPGVHLWRTVACCLKLMASPHCNQEVWVDPISHSHNLIPRLEQWQKTRLPDQLFTWYWPLK